MKPKVNYDTFLNNDFTYKLNLDVKFKLNLKTNHNLNFKNKLRLFLIWIDVN
jgi:hypothetical protein